MNTRNETITRIEFIGGPEDGGMLELGDSPAVVAAEEAEAAGRVPMLLALDDVERLEEGDEFDLVILGCYVSHSCEGSCARFRWVPLP